MIRRALSIAALFFACGCGNPDGAKNVLEGSLSVVMDLGWDRCNIEITQDDVAVTLIRVKGQLQDVTLKVDYSLLGQTLNTPSTVDLAEIRADTMKPRGQVSRQTQGDPRTSFPDIVMGQLVFFDNIKAGAHVHGQFNARFADGIEFANGRTVYGPFDAVMPP
ncbi:MAG: hypothetical protein QM723_29610 [Myxococcaceae bacterium]